MTRLLTFNIEAVPLLSLLAPQRRRRLRLATELIRATAADVVVLNEAFSLTPTPHLSGYATTPQLGAIRTRSTWDSTAGRWSVLNGLVGGGVVVASRLPIFEQHQHVYHARQRGTSDAWCHKGAVLVRLDAPDGPLWVVATHLQADEPGSLPGTRNVRLAQLTELRGFVAARVPATEPVVLAGDLNVEYYSGQSDTVGTDHLAASDAVGGRITPDGPMHAYTFDDLTNAYTARTYPHLRNVLDYVGVLDGAARPPLTVHTETLVFPPGAEASDHYPVLATIRKS